MKKLTLMSLFDGSGGFPLSAVLHNVDPVYASEIEPFPIKVTKKNFPNMTHLGNVLNIKGNEIDPVDIITFGSPCQDISIAGKREGIENGSRSNLYFEAVRIIKEMLDKTNHIYPQALIFENVPNLLTINNGNDFTTALDIIQDLGFIPDVNILDSQYMGVPQRRQRIFITWINKTALLNRINSKLTKNILKQMYFEYLILELFPNKEKEQKIKNFFNLEEVLNYSKLEDFRGWDIENIFNIFTKQIINCNKDFMFYIDEMEMKISEKQKSDGKSYKMGWGQLYRNYKQRLSYCRKQIE